MEFWDHNYAEEKLQKPEIYIKEKLHKFRAISELKSEAKGGYLNAIIKIPATNPDFKLALYSTNNQGTVVPQLFAKIINFLVIMLKFIIPLQV